MVSFVIPKGSLEAQTLSLLEDANLPVVRGGQRDYHASIKDDRIEKVAILRPQEIGKYVQEGFFDLGITGLDWIAESGSDVVELADLPYAKGGMGRALRIVLAVSQESDVKGTDDMPPDCKVATEYPNITQRYFREKGIPVRVYTSYGATEAKVPEIVDAIVELTETGITLKRHGMRIVDTLMETTTKLIANKERYQDPVKRKVMGEITILIVAAINARSRVLVKLNVSAENKDAVLGVIPSAKSPTINQLANGDFAVEAVVDKSITNSLIPQLKDSGATDILEISLSKIVD